MDPREHLEAVAQALATAPRGWHARLQRAGDDPQELDALGRALGDHWHGRAQQASRKLMRSPLYRTKKPLPNGQNALYTYERTIWPVPLEKAVAAPPGWEAEALVCRNLLAAYSTLLCSLQDLQEQPATVRCWHPRRHLPPLLDCLAPKRWSSAISQKTLESSLRNGRADLFLVNAVDWEPLPPTQGVLVLDLTDRPDFPLELVLDGPWLVATIQRWDARKSYGLELSMPAEVRLYAPLSDRQPLSPLATASELARRVRSVVGAAPDATQLWEWCLPPFVDWRRLEHRERRLPLPRDLDDFRRRAAQRGILEGEQRGAIGHRFRVTPHGLMVGLGMLSPELLDDLPPARRRRVKANQPEWPPEPPYTKESTWLEQLKEWRARTLEIADRHEPSPLEELEERLLRYDDVQHALLFSSAMAALAALSLLMPRLDSDARYFETHFLHEVLHVQGSDVRWEESVQYDWELTPVQPGRTDVLVFDTTLTGNRVKLPPANKLAVRVFSVLKLDQRGQELENGGAVLLRGEHAATIQQALKALRRAMGTEPARRRLSPPWILNPEDDHAERVFQNNAWLAQNLEPGGLLERLAHPATAPFCVLHLKDDTLECHAYLTSLIEKLSRGIPFGRGASFGFVDHRHEYILPVLKEDRALLKVAMGSSPGPSRQHVLEILQQALQYPDLASLRRAHPDLQAAEPPADWSAPSPRMLRYLAGSRPAPVQP